MTRSFVAPATGITARESAPGRRQISGIIPFGSKSVDMGFTEIINPTAFDRAFDEAHDVRALFGHSSTMPLARVGNGTLRLTRTVSGLLCEADLPDTDYAENAWQLIRSGTAPGMSFGFTPVSESWTQNEKTGEITVYLDDVILFEVSFCVTFPAYPETSSEARTQ